MEEVVDQADEGEWMDGNTRWQRTLVSISVPFSMRMKNPGPKEFIIGDLYH
jgi:hypothetical protein